MVFQRTILISREIHKLSLFIHLCLTIIYHKILTQLKVPRLSLKIWLALIQLVSTWNSPVVIGILSYICRSIRFPKRSLHLHVGTCLGAGAKKIELAEVSWNFTGPDELATAVFHKMHYICHLTIE